MKNTQALITSAVIAFTGLGLTPEAKAATCMEFLGGQMCNEIVANTYSGQVYNAGFYNGELKESFSIVCDDREAVEFSSNGNMTQAQAEYFVHKFCALPNVPAEQSAQPQGQLM